MKKNIITLLICSLFSFVLYAQSALDDIRFNVAEYQIVGENPLGDQAKAILAPFVGEQYGLEGLSAAADALEQALNKAGYSFHRVNLPPQELFSGSVILEIVQFKIGAVSVTGNQFYDEKNIKRSVPYLKSGIAPNTKKLSQAVKQANINATKSIVLRFNEGEVPNTVDAELKVTDRDPQMFFLSLDNTGGSDSEPTRLTLGYQNSNVLNKDHSLTATLTTSPQDTEAATQFGLSYQIPFYSNASKLSILLSSSESNAGTTADTIVTGKGNVFGVTYNKAIFSSSDLEQSWSIGVMYKLFDNDAVSASSKVLSLPLELAYNVTSRGAQSAFSAGISVAANLETGSDNTDTAYASARANATSSWSAVRYHLSADYLISKDWLLHFNFSGQSSSDRLISGEQFGVGGSSTLRGFEERSINGDEGYFYRVELWMPEFTAYQIRWLVFADQAHITLKETNALFNDGLDEDLSSVGLGIRWSWKQNLSVNLDLGKITKGGGADSSINQDDDSKAHFSLVYRF